MNRRRWAAVAAIAALGLTGCGGTNYPSCHDRGEQFAQKVLRSLSGDVSAKYHDRLVAAAERTCRANHPNWNP